MNDNYRYNELRNLLIKNCNCFYQFVFGLRSFKDIRDISKENSYVVSLTILFNKKQYNDFKLLKKSFINSCSHKIGTNVKNSLFDLLSNLNNEKVIINFEKSNKYNLLKENSKLRKIMNNKVNYLHDVVDANDINILMRILDNFICKIDNEITNYKLFNLGHYYKEK